MESEETSTETTSQTEPTESDETEQTSERNVIDPSSFPTLELTLNEARHQYDDEEHRRSTIESKIGMILTVDALLISFGSLFNQGIQPTAIVVVLLPALISVVLSISAIYSRYYQRPGKNIENFYQYSGYESTDNQREQLLLDYIEGTDTNRGRNNRKVVVFNICIALTVFSLALLLFLPVLDHLGVIEWVVSSARSLLR